MNIEAKTLTAKQGSQPSFGSLRVGIVDLATIDGVSKARLLLRLDSGDKAVTVTEGDSVSLPHHAELILEKVSAGVERSVTLTVRKLQAGAGA